MFCGTGYPTQGLVHVGQAFYSWCPCLAWQWFLRKERGYQKKSCQMMWSEDTTLIWPKYLCLMIWGTHGLFVQVEVTSVCSFAAIRRAFPHVGLKSRSPQAQFRHIDPPTQGVLQEPLKTKPRLTVSLPIPKVQNECCHHPKSKVPSSLHPNLVPVSNS